MKKQILAVSLAAVLALFLLAGCTEKQQDNAPGSNPSGTDIADITPPAGEYTGGPTWGKPASKMAVNFEGRVAAVEAGRITLEDGTIVLTDGAEISAPDGSAAEIAIGDYIQGYAEDPDAAELKAASILVTAL